MAHTFRTHFWFVDERQRTADDPSSAQWLRKVAEGEIFGNAFSEKRSLARRQPGRQRQGASR